MKQMINNSFTRWLAGCFSPLKGTKRPAHNRGSIITELAFVAPVLITLMLGALEVTRYVLLHQKLDRVASTVADLVSRDKNLTQAQLQDYITAAATVARPFQLGNRGLVIISSINRLNQDNPRVVWQQSGGGTLSATSIYGNEGEIPTLPSGFTLNPNENVITVEAVYSFTPWLFEDVVEPTAIRHTALFRPRIANLTTIQ